MNEMFLTRMKVGQKGTVVQIVGGRGISLRLYALGIRPGQQIVKMSAHFWRGPVTVGIGRARIALGFGMASRILVRVEE